MSDQQKPADFDTDELLALAGLDMEQQRHEAALRKLKQVLNAESPPAESLAMVAKVYAQIGLLERAQTHFERYLEQVPDARLERFQWGMALFQGNNLSAALDVWEQVLREQSFFPPAQYYKHLALAQLGDVDTARQGLEAMLKSLDKDNLYFARARDLLSALESGHVPREPGQRAPDTISKNETMLSGRPSKTLQ